MARAVSYVALGFVAACAIVSAAPRALGAEAGLRIPVRISWGHASHEPAPFHVALSGRELSIAAARPIDFEPDDRVEGGAWITRAGGGDVDGIECSLAVEERKIEPTGKIHPFWRAYLEMSDSGTRARLLADPCVRPDPRILTVRLDPEGTRGFSLTLDQILSHRTFWIPSLDVYIAAGEEHEAFEEHVKKLEAKRGARVLDRVLGGPEATYAEFAERWEDMGSPAYEHPSQPPPGHVICVGWDSGLYKFGIDRGAGVWNDYGSSDRLRLWLDVGELSKALRETWRGQRLEGGLPIVETAIERDCVRYEIEQFAYPLHGPPSERRGDIAMVLFERIRARALEGRARKLSLRIHHWRGLEREGSREVGWRRRDAEFSLERGGRTLLAISGGSIAQAIFREEGGPLGGGKDSLLWTTVESVVEVDIPAAGPCELILKLPSPPVPADEREALHSLSYEACRSETRRFWEDWEARGACFRTPEKLVNDLIRANLWHALRLPRRHGGSERGVAIDLPYSNFAYEQRGIPWPVNQAVYVDYMIYDLRGYHSVSAEELLAIFRANQKPDGRIAGYANWGVYTPSMLYATAKHYLLSGDRSGFEELLPYALKALDWCLGEIARSRGDRAAGGLVRAPLNDLTGEGIWAFTQAYFYAGLELFGRALGEIGHPRAEECSRAAREFREAVERAFARASVLSPLVPLRDGTWIPYVPCEATRPSRLLEEWYPTDVDTGALHLVRLGALPANGILADCLLADHEDNLYFGGWGMANEPVYNPQATAYLLRDEPEAAIRAFWSYAACAFSHGALEPVEHRWTWGQYFGPPSTDGAWFELLRNMILRELDDGSLFLFQAVPRAWFSDGRRIEVERAPTYFGPVSLALASRASSGEISAAIEVPARKPPKRLIVRFRHPDRAPMRSATVRGEEWRAFDPKKEWVVIEGPDPGRYEIVAHYEAGTTERR